MDRNSKLERLGCWETIMQVETSDEEDNGDEQCYIFRVLLGTLNGIRSI
jgi:hypothetical protein